MKCFHIAIPLTLSLVLTHSALAYSVPPVHEIQYGEDHQSQQPMLTKSVYEEDRSSYPPTEIPTENEEDTTSRRGLGHFFKKLGCDIARGTKTVTKKVAEGEVWRTVKSGYELVKSFFGGKKMKQEQPEVKVEEKEIPAVVTEEFSPTTTKKDLEEETESPSTLPPITTTKRPFVDIEYAPTYFPDVDASPEIDIRFLGGADRDIKEPVLVGFT